VLAPQREVVIFFEVRSQMHPRVDEKPRAIDLLQRSVSGVC
jgi:hypothetical protein